MKEFQGQFNYFNLSNKPDFKTYILQMSWQFINMRIKWNDSFGVLTFDVKTYNQSSEIVVCDMDKLYCGRKPVNRSADV